MCASIHVCVCVCRHTMCTEVFSFRLTVRVRFLLLIVIIVVYCIDCFAVLHLLQYSRFFFDFGDACCFDH